jgi:hypothetical protein
MLHIPPQLVPCCLNRQHGRRRNEAQDGNSDLSEFRIALCRATNLKGSAVPWLIFIVIKFPFFFKNFFLPCSRISRSIPRPWVAVECLPRSGVTRIKQGLGITYGGVHIPKRATGVVRCAELSLYMSVSCTHAAFSIRH